MVVALSVALTSCLVTDRPEFGEPNIPANLRVVAPATFTRVPAAPDPQCEADRGYMAFEVLVSDSNIADTLEARLFINGVNAVEAAIAATGKVARAPIRLCPKLPRLRSPCSHVELVVSGKFLGKGPYGVRDPDDLALVDWWVLPAAATNPMATEANCASLLDGGLP